MHIDSVLPVSFQKYLINDPPLCNKDDLLETHEFLFFDFAALAMRLQQRRSRQVLAEQGIMPREWFLTFLLTFYLLTFFNMLTIIFFFIFAI